MVSPQFTARSVTKIVWFVVPVLALGCWKTEDGVDESMTTPSLGLETEKMRQSPADS
jgi:hypothetical protein